MLEHTKFARPGWVTSNEVSGSSLPSSVSSRITSFLLFICMWDWPHFAAQPNVAKDSTKNSWLFSMVMMILNQVLPLALSQLTVGRQLKKVNKPAGYLPIAAKGWYLTRLWWKMLIAIEGPKVKDTKSGAVICRACTENLNSAVDVRGRILTG